MGLGAILKGEQYVLNQWLLCGALSPSFGIQRFRNQRGEGGKAIISSDPLMEVLLCVPTT